MDEEQVTSMHALPELSIIQFNLEMVHFKIGILIILYARDMFKRRYFAKFNSVS